MIGSHVIRENESLFELAHGRKAASRSPCESVAQQLSLRAC